jgi:chemotaxis signal transduction protein
MTIAQCQKNAALNKNFGLVQENSPDPATKRMLKFDTGENIYGIDLGETMEVIRDLMMIQLYNSKSITRHFIKFNRRNTIVFNLDQCLAFQGKGIIGHKHPSFVMLDEKIDDACVGILVPGVKAVLGGTKALHATKDQKDDWNIPLHAVTRTSRRGYGKKSRDAVSVINLRELVDNCIIHLKYLDSMQRIIN